MRQGILLGLTGYATSGKDVLADALVEDYGYVKLGWSNPLCELALVINPLLEVPAGKWWGWLGFESYERLQAIVELYGWVEAKKIPSVREFLQKLGTEGCRECLGEDVFLTALKPEITSLLRDGKNVVITNCRFKNEAQMIRMLGGDIVKVDRPGVGPVNQHKSDSGLVFDMANHTIANDGSERDLAGKAGVLHNSIKVARKEYATGMVDPGQALAHFEGVVDRSLAVGLDAVLDIAKPAGCERKDWVSRHKVLAKIAKLENGIEMDVVVDGENAGYLNYADGVLVVEAYIARTRDDESI